MIEMKTKKTRKIQKHMHQINKPIIVRSKKYNNTLHLRPLGVYDLKFLHKIIRADLHPRDFTVKVIRQASHSPKPGERKPGERKIKEFPDEYLTRIATRLVTDPRMEIKNLPKCRITYELFKQFIIEYASKKDKEMKAWIAGTEPILEFLDIYGEDIKQGGNRLEVCGYRHTSRLLTEHDFKYLANLGPRAIHADITNLWLNITRQYWFKEELKSRFMASSISNPRWKIVEVAWEAHNRREYYLSVPIFLTQVEGILGDELILNCHAKSKKGKLFELDTNGSIKIENNKEKELIGITAIIEHPYFGDRRFELINRHLKDDKIIIQRNAIIHGRNTSYGQAKLSTQLLLLLYVLF